MKHVKTTIDELLARARRWHFKYPTDPDYIPISESMVDAIAKYRITEGEFSETSLLKNHHRADFTGCPVELRRWYRSFYRALKAHGLPVYAHTCFRSPELQEHLRQRGLSQLGSGAHQRAAAIDVVHGYYHWAPDRNFWRVLGVIGKQVAHTENLDLVWGGDFKTLYDPAHWELADWRSRAKVIPHEKTEFLPTTKRVL